MDERGLHGNGAVSSYRDLRVWNAAMDLAVACYQLTRAFPRDELFGMTGQIRRASASVPANIAEGYGRGTRKDYANFLYVARGSLKELETHLVLAERVSIASPVTVRPLLDQADAIGKMLHGLITSLQRP